MRMHVLAFPMAGLQRGLSEIARDTSCDRDLNLLEASTDFASAAHSPQRHSAAAHARSAAKGQ